VIIGAHTILYSRDAEADRAFIRDVLGFTHIDAGHGWLIFALPPAEVAVHPSDENNVHELFLMTDDLAGLMADLKAKGVACSPPEEPRWGILTRITLPGGGQLGVYQPRHPTAF
jgi:catechol 2,3-dioxygenase-like lactoylglutathione lyase family enzyme